MGKLLIDLNTFKVIKKTDLGKEEPYLWLFGIDIDFSTGSSNDPTRFILKRPAAPGNLGGPFKKGESRAIPDSVGRIEKDVQPIFANPALGIIGKLALGFIAMTWDHDKTPASAVQAAYGDAAQVLNDFIQTRASALNTGPISNDEMAAIKRNIEGDIRDRFKAAVPLRLNQDDFVAMDFRFITPNPAVAQNENLNLHFAARSVEYQVTGVFGYTP
jgi:hypothetical protein